MSKQLETDVWSLDRCAGCGLCIAACSKQVLSWGDDGRPFRESRTKNLGYTRVELDSCTYCQKFCAEVCPRLVSWNPIPAQVTVAAKARGPIDAGGPNDVIRSIVAAGLSAGLIDGAIMLDLDPWQLRPEVRTAVTVEEVASAVGIQGLWAPVFDALNEAVFEKRMAKLAVVATPCAAQAVRRLKESTNPRLKVYQDAIHLTIANFCTGVYREEMIDELLIKEAGIPVEHVRRLTISADGSWLNVTLWDDQVHRIPRQRAEEYTRAGCGSCTDYSGESADLAVGDLGSAQGWSTLVIRTRTGDAFVRNSVRMRLLETRDDVDEEALAQAAAQKRGRDRAQAFDTLELLMLDALVDPAARGEAIQQFARLYRTPTHSRTVQPLVNGCTGC